MMKYLIGAYLIKAPASTPAIEHYLVALLLTDGYYRWYRVVEKTTEGPDWYETSDWDESWVIERAVAYRNLGLVLARLQSTGSWTGYDALVDNCEQYGRFVVEGKHYSTQVRALSIVVGGIAALALMK